MTFESMNDVTPTNAGVNANSASYPVLPHASAPVAAHPPLETPVTLPPPALVNQPVQQGEPLSVKVLFGNDIRRATYNGGFAPLLDVCAKLYELDPATIALKYQDEDGDKITMSSDEELKEAMRLSKDKAIRVFVEMKTAPTPPAQQGVPAFPGGMMGMGTHWRGPFRGGRHGPGGPFGGGFRGHRGGFHHHGHHAHPHPPHGPHHPPHHPAPPHVNPFGHHGPYFQPPFSPMQTISVQQTDGATYSVPRVHDHGVFSPADATMSHCKAARADASPYDRDAWKERKSAMKEQFKFLKASCNSKEDYESFKLLKHQMYAECKAEKDLYKCAKKAEKSEKYDKCADKWEKKCKDKKDKKDKCKDKKDKCDKKWEKKYKNKDGRLVARHVADVTIPDNSELPAGTPVTKTWRLRNDGVLAWPTDSQLIFISKRGDDLNGPERVHVGTVEPQNDIDVSVTFITPAEPGRYTGYYRMATADGKKFGQRVWVSFVIPGQDPITATETTQPSAPADINMVE